MPPPDGMSGGGKLEGRLAGMVTRLGGAKEVRIGFLEGSTESDGTSLPMIAAIQEFGAPRVGIPPRPYFRGMVKRHKGEWSGELGKVLVTQDYDSERSLRLMGERIGGELRQSIVDLTSPPLSPVTLMLRKMRAKDPDLKMNRTVVAEARARVKAGESTSGVSTKPLVDSGGLLGGIDYEVTRE